MSSVRQPFSTRFSGRPPVRPPGFGLVALALSGALAVGCSGQIAGNSGAGGDAPTGTGGSGSVSGSGGNQTGGSGGTTGNGTPSSLLNLPDGSKPTPSLHKLTSAEFANSVHDLLGDGAPLSVVEPDNVANGIFAPVGAAVVSISPAGVGQYEAALGGATEYAFADPTRAAAVLSCMPTGPTDKTCATQALSAFGRRAFRRPLTDAETTRFVTLATTIAGKPSSSILSGMRHAVWAILQSPSFLYRVELGTASPADGGRLKYDNFEIASRLAGTLWGSVPDDTLLDAAAQGKLATSDGVRAQAERMMADPRAHRAFTTFVGELYGKRELDEATKDPAMFPAFTTTLRDAMQHELEQRLDDLVFTQKGDYLSLFDSKTTFVNNELAAYYGLPAAATDGWRKATLPDSPPRVGLLGAGAILSAFAHPQRTSATARGKFVANSLLCRSIPDPPPGIAPLPSTPGPNQTWRQVLSQHRTAAQCAVCHGVLDPLGFGMETFDAAAKYRTTDNGQPIDATGSIDGMAFNGLAEMSAVIRKQAVAGPCFVSKVYSYLQGRSVNNQDAAALDALATRFASSGNLVNQLLLELVSSDAFRFVEPVKP